MSEEIQIEQATVEVTGPKCLKCDSPLNSSDRFCRHCGTHIAPDQDTDIANTKWNAIRQLGLFFLIEVVICATSYLKLFNTFGWSVFMDATLAIAATIFFSLNWQTSAPLLKWNNFSISRLAGYCLLAILASCLISFVVDWLNGVLLGKRWSVYLFYASQKNAFLLSVIFVAMTPAIFEELAFRVFLLGKLLAVFDKRQAAFLSAFMFAIVHMSFVSLFWLIPFGLVLAYVRTRQNTMWYGTCIHFCFNLTAVFIDMLLVMHR